MFNKNGVSAWIAKSEGKNVEWKLNGLDWQELTDKEFLNWDNSRFVSEDSDYFFRIVEDNKMLGNYKIRVNSEDESKEAQELFFELGYGWYGDCKVVDYSEKIFGNHCGWLVLWKPAYLKKTVIQIGCGTEDCEEITLPKLRDLVVLHRNNLNDATHVGNYCGHFYVTCDGDIYSWEKPDVWKKNNYNTMNDIKPIQTKPVKQGLISGADALRALADGDHVEYWCEDLEKWVFMDMQNHFKRKFRVKPRTITLNVEIPVPFEPKEDCDVFILNDSLPSGYQRYEFDVTDTKAVFFGVWKTEEQIKQVVEALRSGIKGVENV